MHSMTLATITKSEVTRIVGSRPLLSTKKINSLKDHKIADLMLIGEELSVEEDALLGDEDIPDQELSERTIKQLDSIIEFRAKRISNQWNKHDRALARDVNFRYGMRDAYEGVDGEYHNYNFTIIEAHGVDIESDIDSE